MGITQAKEDFRIQVEEKQNNGGFKRGDLQNILKTTAENHNVPQGTLRTYYYNKLKRPDDGNKKEEKENEVVVEQKETTKEKEDKQDEGNFESNDTVRLVGSLKTPELRPERPPYKRDEEIGVKIDSITHFGAFVKTTDGYEYKGLIHISEIADWRVDDVNEYFEVGQKLNVKVKRIDKKNRLEFTTRHLNLTKREDYLYPNEEELNKPMKETIGNGNPPINSMSEQLQGLKGKISYSTEEMPNKVEGKEDYWSDEDIELGAEFNDIIDYMNSVTGMVSPKAKAKMKEVVSNHGLFKLAMAMGKVAEEFDNDLGVKFLEEIEEKLSEGL